MIPCRDAGPTLCDHSSWTKTSWSSGSPLVFSITHLSSFYKWYCLDLSLLSRLVHWQVFLRSLLYYQLLEPVDNIRLHIVQHQRRLWQGSWQLHPRSRSRRTRRFQCSMPHPSQVTPRAPLPVGQSMLDLRSPSLLERIEIDFARVNSWQKSDLQTWKHHCLGGQGPWTCLSLARLQGQIRIVHLRFGSW